MSAVCLGRQPIYDRELKVMGYRIVPQSEEGESKDVLPQVIVEELAVHGLDKIIGVGKAMIQMPAAELGNVADYLPMQRFILEVGADVKGNAEAREAVANLAKAGYEIALVDSGYAADLGDFYDSVNYLMLDTTQMSKDAVAAAVRALHGKRTKVIATHIDSHNAFRDYSELGLHYFQGHFVAMPDVDQGGELKASRLGSMRLLAKLQDPNLELADLEAIVEADVSLSYKLLRYLNSAFFALPTKVESIKRALLLLGLRPVRNWASMIVLAGFDDKPEDLIITAMLRAKFCEQLARAYGQRSADVFFTVGLLSTLDAFLNKPMQECLDLVPLSDDVKKAITERAGVAGEILQTVMSYERGQVKRPTSIVAQGDVSMADTFLEAVSWVTECSAEIIVGNMSRRAA